MISDAHSRAGWTGSAFLSVFSIHTLENRHSISQYIDIVLINN